MACLTPILAPKTRNRSPGQTTHRRSHEMVHRPGTFEKTTQQTTASPLHWVPTHKRPQHMKALHHSQVGAAAIRTVEATDAHWATIAAFKFLTLTATRSGEVRNATWNEIDLSTKAVWTIPSEHTKTGQEHRVPLTTGALAILATALPRSGGKGLVFPSPTGRVAQQRDNEQTLQRKQSRLCPPRNEKLIPRLVRRNRR